MVIRSRKTCVMMQGLSVYRQIMAARLDHSFHPLTRRRMDEVDRCASRSGESDRPLEGELFRKLAVHQMEVGTVDQAFGAKFLVIELDQVVILGMDHHDSAMAGRPFHRVANPSEVELEWLTLRMRRQDLVGKDLEAGKALLDSLRHLLEDPEWQRPAERDMKAVVDVRLAPPTLDPARQRRGNVGRGMDENEIKVGRNAAPRHPAGIFFGPERKHPAFRMHPDQTGQMG